MNIYYTIRLKRKGAKTNKFDNAQDAAYYMNNRHFRLYEIVKYNKGKKIIIQFESSQLEKFRNQLINS
jgi:hypothetical protein